jgi:hypothetical protein
MDPIWILPCVCVCVTLHFPILSGPSSFIHYFWFDTFRFAVLFRLLFLYLSLPYRVLFVVYVNVLHPLSFFVIFHSSQILVLVWFLSDGQDLFSRYFKFKFFKSVFLPIYPFYFSLLLFFSLIHFLFFFSVFFLFHWGMFRMVSKREVLIYIVNERTKP